MTTNLYLQQGLIYGGIGMLLGGGVGVLKVYITSGNKEQQVDKKNTFDNNNNNNNITSKMYGKYEFIVLDPSVVEVFNRFESYKSLIGEEYESILYNMNKLIGLQVKINEGKKELSYPHLATKYVTNIQMALNSSKLLVRNQSVPHWETDEQSVQQIANDYLYNISQDIDEYLLTGQRNR